MLSNKVVFVCLLVCLALFFQPTQGERLSTRVAGGFRAVAGQLPFVVYFTYPFTAGGVSSIYNGTGFVYDVGTVVTSANAVANCADGTVMTVGQGVVDVNTNVGTETYYQITCSRGNNIKVATGFTAGQYTKDFATITLNSGNTFPVASVARMPTSSPTPEDIDNLFVAGYGETVPTAGTSPQLNYIPLNPMTNRRCSQNYEEFPSIVFSFADNFCLQGQNPDSRTTFLTDACTFDAGAPIFRTSNVVSPTLDFEVVGIVNLASCTAAVPVIATYLTAYAPSFTGAQSVTPTPANPSNPRASDGNFICGDGVKQAGNFEKCDIGVAGNAVGSCCNPWTCQFKTGGPLCSTNGQTPVNNGTRCSPPPRCNRDGKCVVSIPKNDPPIFNCRGKGTKCVNGKCCNFANNVATNCV